MSPSFSSLPLALALMMVGCLNGSSPGEGRPSARSPSLSKGSPRGERVDASLAVDGGGEERVLDGGGDGAIEREADVDVLAIDGAVSTSIGGPNNGSVTGGFPFPKRRRGVVLNPRRLNKNGHYGTVELVQALVRAAAVVDRELPGGHSLVVNDIGFEQGGPIPHHGSHQSGRDVDVLFYLFDRDGNPRPAKGVPLNLKGRGWDFNDLADPEDDLFVKIDAQRTWRLLQALVEDEESLLQRIYVAEHIRTILLKAAKRAKAPRSARQRVEELTCQPGTPHDDHFHFRFFCSAEDIEAGCEDSGPMYPWRRNQLREEEVSFVLAKRRPRRRSKTVSIEEAIAKAGPMHWKVKAFLREREAWSKRPHPGRTWCR